MTKPCLIMIGAGTLQVPTIHEAHQLGLSVIAIDSDPKAPGMALAEYPLAISMQDIPSIFKAVEKLAETVTLKGVMTAGTDASFIVATIAKHFHLKGISPETALNCTNKWNMRNTLKDASIPVPEFFLVRTKDEARNAFTQMKSGAAVIKPLDNMGARGVKQIFSAKEAYDAFEESASYSTNHEVLLEELLEGPELSIDSLIFNGQFVPCGVADRIITKDPYFIEIGHNLPSSMDESLVQSALDMLYQGSIALGIHWGAAKGDIKMTPQGPRIVEIAARLSGGFMSGFTFPYASGVNLTKAAVMLAIDMVPSLDMLTPKENNVCIERGILAHKKGVLQNIHHIQDALKIPYIMNIFITKPLHTLFGEITSNVDKIGHIIAKAPSLELAEDAIKKVFSCLKIDIIEPAI